MLALVKEVSTMSEIATKKAARQIQKIFDKLGKYGGVIETDDPYW